MAPFSLGLALGAYAGYPALIKTTTLLTLPPSLPSSFPSSGFRWASFSLGLVLGAYAVCLVMMNMSGSMPWMHHRDPRQVSEGRREGGREKGKEGGKVLMSGRNVYDMTSLRLSLRHTHTPPSH